MFEQFCTALKGCLDIRVKLKGTLQISLYTVMYCTRFGLASLLVIIYRSTSVLKVCSTKLRWMLINEREGKCAGVKLSSEQWTYLQFESKFFLSKTYMILTSSPFRTVSVFSDSLSVFPFSKANKVVLTERSEIRFPSLLFLYLPSRTFNWSRP